jgi:hypothetical protein
MQNNLMKNDPLFSFEVVMIKIYFNQKKKKKKKKRGAELIYCIFSKKKGH